MIVRGHPELGLQEHQQEAYSAVTGAFEKGNRASVVIPTGCGKSFIALQLMQDNKDKNILFMAPTIAIKNQMYNYIAKYIVGEEPTKERTARQIAEEYFPNLKIMLYPTLAKMKDETMEKLNPDIIIMDELHRTGADKWGPKVNTLLDKHPSAKVLGLTATPDRMDDKNVVDELFGGKIDYELTLVDAIKRGIVKPPKYVKCDYALGEMLEDVKAQIDDCDNETTKKELQDKYDRMRRIVDQAEGIPELFAKNMTKKDGKYIVFCKDKEHMEQMMEEAKKWFADIDSDPEMYSVYSGDGSLKNQETIKQFEESKSGHLKLLFSIDMLNEGLHVEDISGVIMLRPTDSRIIYLQQLGRALSSDKSREQTIIFDLVNNYLINNLDREINTRTKKEENNERPGKQTERSDSEKDYDEEDIDIFRIQGETKEFLELFGEINETIAKRGTHLRNARDIKAWMEERKTTKPPSVTGKDEEERRLGNALRAIRQLKIKPYEGLKEKERAKYRKEHPDLEEILRIVKWIDENKVSSYLVNARAIKAWMEERKTTKPPSEKTGDEEEKKLGRALRYIKSKLIKPYMELKTEEERERYKQEHLELDEVMEIVSWIDNRELPVHLVNARKIKKWMDEKKTIKPPSAKSEDEVEKNLGVALLRIRNNLIKPYLILETDEEKNKYIKRHPELKEVMEIVKGIDENSLTRNIKGAYLINAKAIKIWMEERNTTSPPASRKEADEEEKRLALALGRIRTKIIRPYLRLETDEEQADFRKKHPEVDEVMEIVSWIDNRNLPIHLANARAIKKWMLERNATRQPSVSKEVDEEEQNLGKALSSIRHQFIKKYLQLQTEEERKEFREKHPEIEEVMEIINWIDENNLPIKLVQAREIKKWMEERKTTKPPISIAKDKEESRLGKALINIRKELIKPYLTLETEEQKEQYRREHPEIEEVVEIINWVDENNLSTNLVNARAIKAWMEKKSVTRPPNKKSKDDEEKRLGVALGTIRYHLIKPYLELETEEEKAKYRGNYPELEEVMEIINWIDENNLPIKLVQAREIKKWMEERKTTKPPSATGKDEEERRLGRALSTIRSTLIKPYLDLKTEEEQEEYMENHPELDVVLEIVTEIDLNSGDIRRIKLGQLIQQDRERRGKIKAARDLVAQFEGETRKQGIGEEEEENYEE